jgi:hypothetical protein
MVARSQTAVQASTAGAFVLCDIASPEFLSAVAWQVVQLTADICKNLKVVKDVPVPSPGEGEVLINMSLRCA